MTTPKRERVRLAKSEVWLHLAITAQRWADQVADNDDGHTLPFADWPPDDPLVALCRTYHLTAADLAKACEQIAQSLEDRADRCGYERHWDEDRMDA